MPSLQALQYGLLQRLFTSESVPCATGYRDLAMNFARDVYEHTKAFPSDERFGLVSQLRRAAVSVPSNIAEGSRRLLTDNLNFLRYALGSLAECDTQLLIAESLGYGEYTRKLKATIMSLTISLRAYGKTIKEP